MNVKKIDWSYNSMPRYILDMNIFMGFAVIAGYFLEQLDSHPMVQNILIAWLMGVGGWLLMRIIDAWTLEIFSKSKEDKTKDKETTAQIELDLETEKALMTYACENNIAISETVTQLLKDYLLHVRETRITSNTEGKGHD